MATPITVFTGFLGSGKTTIILSLLSQLQKVNPNYKVVLLKNEFGDVEVDSKLINNASAGLISVSEIMNGCLCCVLVGQLKTGLEEIKLKYNPDRIIIETSGSAFPAPIAIQIRQLDQTQLKLDSIITVIDAVNFAGYEDTSYTAKLQAQYTDLIILNKVDLCTSRHLDLCIDKINDLNTDTAKINYSSTSPIDLDLIFGIDTKLFIDDHDHQISVNHHDKEVDIIQIYSSTGDDNQNPIHNCEGPNCEKAFHTTLTKNNIEPLSRKAVTGFLNQLASEYDNCIYRVKGFIKLQDEGLFIMNFAFGRFELHAVSGRIDESILLKLTVMGIDLKRAVAKFEKFFLR